MKKYIGALMAGLFILSSASAALQYQPLSQDDAADYLAEEGVIKDYKDNPSEFRLGDGITRQETMKITMKLSGIEIVDACEGEFDDVKSGWGCKYIEAALRAGYIADNDNFRPDDLITKTEVAKLVLKAKNIDKVQLTDNWQEDYMMTLAHYGLIADKYYDYNSNALRGWIFQIVTATLQKEPEIKEEVKKMREMMSDESL